MAPTFDAEIVVDAGADQPDGDLGHQPRDGRRRRRVGARAAGRWRRARARLHGSGGRHADRARSRSTASSSAPARTRAIGDLRAAADDVERPQGRRRRQRDGRAGLRADPREAEERGARVRSSASRLRLAHSRLLDVPGDEPRHRGAGRARRLDVESQLRGPPGRGARSHLVSPQMAAAAAVAGTSSTSGTGAERYEGDRDDHRQGVRADARRRRHRSDHAEAVPQARRAHRLRRVPLLRLGEGARLGPAEAPDPRHRARISAAAPAASTRRGASRTTAFAAIIAPSFADIFCNNCTKIGLLPVTVARGRTSARSRMQARRRSTSPLRRCAGWAGTVSRAASFEIDAETKHRLLNGLDDIDLTLQQSAAIAPTRPIASAAARHDVARLVRPMAHRIAVLPGDGIGPEIIAPTLELLSELGDFTFEKHLFGGASIDAHGAALTDEVERRLPRIRRRPAGRGGRPEVGFDRRRRTAAGAGPARASQGAEPLREPATGQGRAGPRRGVAVEGRERRRHARRSRADRRDLLR